MQIMCELARGFDLHQSLAMNLKIYMRDLLNEPE